MSKGAWKDVGIEKPDEHRRLLVTNNVNARNAFGEPSHVWIIDLLQEMPHAPGYYCGYSGDDLIEHITDWRYLTDSLAPSHVAEPTDHPWHRVSGYGEATAKFGGEGVCVAGVEFIWHLGPNREMYAMPIPGVPSLDGPNPVSSIAEPTYRDRFIAAAKQLELSTPLLPKWAGNLIANNWLIINAAPKDDPVGPARSGCPKGEGSPLVAAPIALSATREPIPSAKLLEEIGYVQKGGARLTYQGGDNIAPTAVEHYNPQTGHAVLEFVGVPPLLLEKGKEAQYVKRYLYWAALTPVSHADGGGAKA